MRIPSYCYPQAITKYLAEILSFARAPVINPSIFSMKIMIVDDHPDMRRVLGNIVTLALDGQVKLYKFESGEEAIAKYAEIEPNVVLMDIEIRSMSGFKVTEEIIAHDSDAKVIIVTSYNTPTFRRKAKQLQTYGFVSKDNLSDLYPLLQSIKT